MASEKHIYTREFKLEAVRLNETTDKSKAQVGRELGSPPACSKWVKQLRTDERRAIPGKGNPRDEETHLLKREIETLKQEREILKNSGYLLPSKLKCTPLGVCTHLLILLAKSN